MKLALIFFVLCSMLLLAWSQTSPLASEAMENKTTQRPTTVTSESLSVDMSKRHGVFSGDVKVEGTDFTMAARELEVFFDHDRKVERLIAIGDVKIVEPNRETTSNRADFDVRTNKMLLTGSPKIIDGGRVMSAPEIVIDRTDNKVQTEQPFLYLIAN